MTATTGLSTGQVVHNDDDHDDGGRLIQTQTAKAVVTTEAPVGFDLAVPAYVHPGVDPGFWERLLTARSLLRFVVVNVHNGPGAEIDDVYVEVISKLLAAGVRLVGYVDTDFGRRPLTDIVADARTWVTRYGVTGVFFDQTSPGFQHLDHYAACSVGVQSVGAHFVVMNPGQVCHQGYLDLANIVVTFEGPWSQYRFTEPTAWLSTWPPSRICHLVYDVPVPQVPLALEHARQLGPGSLFLSDGCGGNPWDRLPEPLLDAVDQDMQDHGRDKRLENHQRPFAWGSRRYHPIDLTPQGIGKAVASEPADHIQDHATSLASTAVRRDGLRRRLRRVAGWGRGRLTGGTNSTGGPVVPGTGYGETVSGFGA